MSQELDAPSGALAPESVVRLDVGGVTAVTWTCTPANLPELAVGWLVSEGIAEGLDDVCELTVVESAGTHPIVAIELFAEADARLWNEVRSAGRSAAWLAGAVEVRGVGRRRIESEPDLRRFLESSRIRELFGEMFEAASLRTAVGGVHTGGLVREGQLLSVVEDVSRHHVVDRLVGRAVLDGRGPGGDVFLLSSRISGAMAAKACRAGIGALVSRSVPTELAASVAARCGLVLMGRARGDNRFIHWPAP